MYLNDIQYIALNNFRSDGWVIVRLGNPLCGNHNIQSPKVQILKAMQKRGIENREPPRVPQVTEIGFADVFCWYCLRSMIGAYDIFRNPCPRFAHAYRHGNLHKPLMLPKKPRTDGIAGNLPPYVSQSMNIQWCRG
jgi:hypothetical protein